jgi:hypothetical protein
LPTQQFNVSVFYFNFYSDTKFGTLGLRIWII